MSEARGRPFFVLSLLSLAVITLADDMSIMQEFAKTLSIAPPNWSGSAPCKWTGITCKGDNEVTGISLAKKSLSGSLPSNLNQLRNLEFIQVQDNNISGPLPSFADLSNLREIFLDKNQFSSVPDSCFSGLTSLQNFSIAGNGGLAPWGFPRELADSESLVDIDASNASLTGVLPDIFGKLINLRSLRLPWNSLTGSLPSSLASTGLQILYLNNQKAGFSGRIDVLGKMRQLSQVRLHKNNFTGPIPDLSNCTNLSELRLRENQLTGIIPPSLTSLTHLTTVELDNNKFQGPYPSFKITVSIRENNFCNDKPGPCDPQVTTLLEIAGDMGYPLSLAESWKGNDACQNWRFVNCNAQKVSVITFAKQQFVGTISPAYADLVSLNKLILSDNNLTGMIPDSLTRLSNLEVLDVSNNNLSGDIPRFKQNVVFKKEGNLLLGKPIPKGEGPSPGSGSAKGSDNSGSGEVKVKKLSAVQIAGLISGALVLISIVVMVSYKLMTRENPMKFGRVTDSTDSRTSHMTETDRDYSDAKLLPGGQVAIAIQVLRQVTDNFNERNIVGKGGFGTVYKGVLHDGTEIAVKRMEATVLSAKGLDEFEAEIAVLTKVRHKHLVAMLGFCADEKERLLVYEYMAQGTLAQNLFQWKKLGRSPLTWMQRATVALDVARGIAYLHTFAQESFIHRDLKSSNILLGDDMRAKVSDFGLVKTAPDENHSIATRLAGTFGYLAPEYVERGKVSTKVDVYAFGAILLEIVTGRQALDDSRPDNECHLVTWFRKVIGNDIGKALDRTLEPVEEIFGDISKMVQLAMHCTSTEPGQRPDMNHAVNVLSSLVEKWSPSEEVEASLGLSFSLTLPELVERWKSGKESSSVPPPV